MKKLIHFDETSYNRAVSNAEAAVLAANEAVQAFNELGAGTVTEELFKLLVNSPGNDEIAWFIKKAVEKALNDAKINITSVRLAAVEETLSMYNKNVYPKFEALKVYNSSSGLYGNSYSIPFLTFKNGAVIFTEADKQRLEESFKYYLESEEGEQLYNLQQEIGAKLNEFCELVGIDAWRLPQSLFQQAFEVSGDVIQTRHLDYNKAKKKPHDIFA